MCGGGGGGVCKNTGIVFSHLRGRGVEAGGKGGWVWVRFSLLIVESSVPQCSEMANC